ncbi:hypothetical protein GCM10010433_62030 [Streptomyces pulveraceus]
MRAIALGPAVRLRGIGIQWSVHIHQQHWAHRFIPPCIRVIQYRPMTGPPSENPGAYGTVRFRSREAFGTSTAVADIGFPGTGLVIPRRRPVTGDAHVRIRKGEVLSSGGS